MKRVKERRECHEREKERGSVQGREEGMKKKKVILSNLTYKKKQKREREGGGCTLLKSEYNNSQCALTCVYLYSI